MWSHYAYNHEGICIQFESIRDFNVFGWAIPVEYGKDYPIIDWLKPPELEDYENIFLKKSYDWKYEKERRIVEPNKANKPLLFQGGALTGVIFGSQVKPETIEAVQILLVERKDKGLPVPILYKAVKHKCQ